MKSFESYRQLVILFWGPICIKNTFYVIACSIRFVILLFWSVLFEKLNCKHLRGSHLLTSFEFPGQIYMWCHDGQTPRFFIRQYRRLCQAQVHHSLLVMYRCEKFWLWRQRTSVRPYRLWGRGREVPRQPDREWRMPSFLGGKSRGAFGQPAFFLAGNCMTIVAQFWKRGFFKKLKFI